MRNFMKMLAAQHAWRKFLCIGFDPVLERIPCGDAPLTFLQKIVDATADIAGFYKPNIQFFLGLRAAGIDGLEVLEDLIQYIRTVAPLVPVILDGKWGDIGSTNDATMKFVVSGQADAVTLNPYVGPEGLEPFLSRKDLGCLILCRTSNKGSDWLQNMQLKTGVRVYEQIAYDVMTGWNPNGNCGLVVGATNPLELAKVRHIVGLMPLLIPGIGTQGGDVEQTVTNGQDGQGLGMVINSSSGITYASQEPNYPEAARAEALRLHGLINSFRKAC